MENEQNKRKYCVLASSDAIYQRIMELNMREEEKMVKIQQQNRDYTLEEAHALASTLKGEEPEIEAARIDSLAVKDIDDLGIDWEKHPVDDDVPVEEEFDTDDLDEKLTFYKDLFTDLEKLAKNNGRSGKEMKSSPDGGKKPKKGFDDDYHFVKGDFMKPQEVINIETREINFRLPDNEIQCLAAKWCLERIAQFILEMRYISDFSLECFDLGKLLVSFEPIHETTGARQMALDCLIYVIRELGM